MTSAEPPVAADEGSPDGGSGLARALLARARAQAALGRTGAGGSTGRPRRGRWTPDGTAARGQHWSGAGSDERDPQALARVVDGLVASSGWSEELSVHGVLARWDLLVGPAVAEHCRVETFTDGRLVLRTDSTAWATHLRHLVPTMLARLAAEVGAGVVTHVDVLGPAAPSWRHGPRVVPGRGPRDTYG